MDPIRKTDEFIYRKLTNCQRAIVYDAYVIVKTINEMREADRDETVAQGKYGNYEIDDLRYEHIKERAHDVRVNGQFTVEDILQDILEIVDEMKGENE